MKPPRLVMLPAGTDRLLNRREYLNGRLYELVLKEIYDRLDLMAGDVDAAMDPSLIGISPVRLTQIRNSVEQVLADGTRSADRLLRQVGRRAPMLSAATVTFDGPQLNQMLIDEHTDRTVSHLNLLADDARERLRASLAQGYTAGESTGKLRQRVMDELGVTRVQATRLARTTTNEVYNSAHLDRYRAAGINAVKYVAAHGEKTCDYCASLDGHIWRINDPNIIQPPVHFQCRCRLIPWVLDVPEQDPVPGETVNAYNDFRDRYWTMPDASRPSVIVKPLTPLKVGEDHTLDAFKSRVGAIDTNEKAFPKFKSVKEMETWANWYVKPGMSMKFDTVKVEEAREVFRNLVVAMKKDPDLGYRLNHIVDKPPIMRSWDKNGTMAYTYQYTDGTYMISVNPYFFDERMDIIEQHMQGEQSRFFVKTRADVGHVEAVIAHEMGHNAVYHDQEWIDYYNKHQKYFSLISRYSLATPEEGGAELYVYIKYGANPDLDNPVVKRYLKMYKKKMGKDLI